MLTENLVNELGDSAVFWIQIIRGGDCDIINITRVDKSFGLAGPCNSRINGFEDLIGDDRAGDKTEGKVIVAGAEPGTNPGNLFGPFQ